MTAYYNEFNEEAAEWLLELIAAGHIAPGDVDTRSIEDVRPDDLRGYTQCHFFAGIGVWSYALRRAGWPDDRPIWTGSCPCQPFSAAGKGAAFADERHLWPAFYHLIAQHVQWCRQQKRPAPEIVGEQVASKAVDDWIDLVHADMEAVGYTFGSIPFPSAGVGAPHIRDRNYWVANANGQQYNGRRKLGTRGRIEYPDGSAASGLEHSGSARSATGVSAAPGRHQRIAGIVDDAGGELLGAGIGPALSGAGNGGLADMQGLGRKGQHLRTSGGLPQVGAEDISSSVRPGPTNGYWADADWLGCRDGKWRPVEASPQPLVDGSAESLGRVRPESIEAIEEEIDAATAQTKGGRAEVMRALLEDIGAQAKCGWPAGRLPGLHEAPFLLAFMRQLQEQGWRIAEGIALPRPEATNGVLRSVWHDQAIAGAPHRRELEEQRASESPDFVRVLSRILARHAQEAWGVAYEAHAEIGFPLGTGHRNRVMRLRGYGNAINAAAAQAWIETVMECIA